MANIIHPTTLLDGSFKRVRPQLEDKKGKKLHPNTVVSGSAYVPTKRDQLKAFIDAMNGRIAEGDLFSGRLNRKSLFIDKFGATRGAMRKGAQFIADCGVNVTGGTRHNGEIRWRGRLGDVARFVPTAELLYPVILDGQTFRYRSGAHEVRAPKGMFTGISGLDTTPLARAHYRRLRMENGRLVSSAVGRSLAKPSAANAWNPMELKPVFHLPGGTGKGQKIGIIALGGGATEQDCIDYARNVLNVQGKIKVKFIAIDGAVIKADPQGADIETVLDMDGSLGAYDATIYVVFAPNTDTGFAHGIGKLIDLGCDVITISWGSAELNWTKQAIDAMHTEFARAQAKGVTVYAAAGDNLAPDNVQDGKVHGDYPSTDTCVISMIGLYLSKDGKIMKIWNNGDSGSGGGVSDVFSQEDWEKIGRQVKSLNDGQIRHWAGGFAGPGDPATGLVVSYNGQLMVVGGTSADGPIYAGLTGCANEFLGKNLGFYLPFVLKNAGSIMIPVTEGDNGMNGDKGYSAEDLTLGMVDFTKLINALKAA